MPSIYSHYLCGNEALNFIKNENLKNTINKYKNEFNLGTQGPDIFFYYRVWPWTNSNGIDEIGDRLHVEKVYSFFSKAEEYLSLQNGSKYEVILSYLCGYICHYALDLSTHPYIFYKTGFSLVDEPDDPKYSYYHRKFETTLDVLMVDRLLSKKTREIKPHKLIEIDSESMTYIEDMYNFILKDMYNINLSKGQVCTCIKDMISVQSALYDSFGIKKKGLYTLEKLMGKLPLMSCMIHPRSIKDDVDYLNLDQNPWYSPWDKDDKHISSFIDMFNNAVTEGVSMCINFSTESKDIWNRSFSSGLDCDNDIEFKYFDCVYE